MTRPWFSRLLSQNRHKKLTPAQQEQKARLTLGYWVSPYALRRRSK